MPRAKLAADADPLKTYREKRDFRRTAEPADGGAPSPAAGIFVVQKHWASRLHYDFRLELDGTLKSWAVPKGPSFDPADKRMAVQVEDHPLAYADFEGEIPPGQYGAGRVVVWDKGTWTALGDARQGYRDGHLKFRLHGERLRGKWVLIRIRGKENADGKPPKQPPWLLIKEKDDGGDSPRSAPNPAAGASVEEHVETAVRTATKERASIRNPRRATKRVADAVIALPPAAVPAELPAILRPQLATLVERAPGHAEDWLYEIKYDGYRLLAHIDSGAVSLFTRAGNDWSARLPELVAALRGARLPAGWYDGEIIVVGENGVPDFQALQGAFDGPRTQPILYVLFDVPYCAGHDLRGVPLVERRTLLQTLLAKVDSPLLRLSDALDAESASAASGKAAEAGPDILTAACRLGLEGVIGKRRQSAYLSRRSNDWIKLKCGRRQEFVIGGYTDPQGSRSGIGALLLGVQEENDKGSLRYAGKVGTGFDERTLTQLAEKLADLASRQNPFAHGGGAHAAELRKAHWVKPVLLAEVSFANWTAGGRLRHAVFHGLRIDKPARGIVREEAMPAPEAALTIPSEPAATVSAATPVPPALPPALKITHPDRVIDRSSGATKLDLLNYYAAVAPLMLPHLYGRPVSLLRAPAGIAGPAFFQKHLDAGAARQLGVIELPAWLDPEHPPLMAIADADGLLAGVQMNVVELHTWNALRTAIDRPDRMTFDLDPGADVAWEAMQESAILLKNMLDHLGLPAYLKTSGGKGLHVVVPLVPKFGWGAVKDFSQAIVRHLAETLPMRFVAKSGPRNRVGKVFIDYLRNGFGATTVCAWSARARPGLGVSVPVSWDELGTLQGGAHWTIANVAARLVVGNTVWADYPGLDRATPASQGAAAATLGEAMRRLGFPLPTAPARRKGTQ